MAEPAKETHLLTLKVMRLTKPTMVRETPVAYENGLTFPGGVDSGEPMVGVSDIVTLPQSFGSIFLGETFTSYVIAHNESKEKVTNIVVKAELQMKSADKARTMVLLSSADKPATAELTPGASVDDIVSHEVKQLGVHILVCSVWYNTTQDERKFFRKFFRFEVEKPLDIKTKVYNDENEIYLEAQVQNIMSTPMFLHRVQLQAAAAYIATDLNEINTGDGGGAAVATTPPAASLGERQYLNSKDTRQYLFKLTPKDENDPSLRTNTALGKLDVMWRTNFGEQGRLQTSQLSRKTPPVRDIEVKVVEAPGEVRCGAGFTIKLTIKNWSAHQMKLSLKEEQASVDAILLDGQSGSALGTVGPAGTLDITLNLIAVSTGVYTVQGLSLYDSLTKTIHPLKPLPSVFVSHPDAAATV